MKVTPQSESPVLETPSMQDRLAVCSWSLQPGTAAELASRLADTQISRVQLALDPLRENAEGWNQAADLLNRAGITIVSGMFGCIGEDYSTLETIRRTGGLTPDSTWSQNLANIKTTVALARRLGLKLVTFHAGFLPHDSSDPDFKKMLERLAQAADLFASENLDLGLETGQETAISLRELLQLLGRSNLGVNFDPANMILYDKGDPIEALRVLGPWIKQVHIKDAVRTQAPGEWGQEVPAGSGEVAWPAFFATLDELGFTGNYVIEREAGDQRVVDVRTAKALVEGIRNRA